MDSRQHSHAHQRTPYPQNTSQASTSSSAFQSSTSVASVASASPSAMQRSTAMSLAGCAAPLPSPSTQQPASYFATFAAQSPTSLQPNLQQKTFVGQRHSGDAPETAPFLQAFNLLAETAKRAEMACLSRDLNDVGL
ncbi:hypothetical protein CERZMDRAFT_95216 [Cercospora zeae-maydis SCOH1-5]|uniref:Uncharacterized protein n=1 Tax=Cercospora zeae-maydis SCOH1-5 TaxID=717836 RepID=A0A6A6FN17_9PEZI|nr:hypothetical protein CERZMDRAFT_95216 [Cercospora zeae-maydis SCOH1-5]